jgi:catechol 2,3-dioxygenase-like lactoylglutathione lyase family enzyme
MEAQRTGVDVGILVSNVARSLGFYQGILGLEKVEEFDIWFGHVHRLRFGESYIKLVCPLKSPTLNFPRIDDQLGIRYVTFPINNLDEICLACANGGLQFEQPKLELRPGVWIAMIKDPDGTIIEFVQKD